MQYFDLLKEERQDQAYRLADIGLPLLACQLYYWDEYIPSPHELK